MSEASCLDYALYYASLGWPVVALNWPLKDGRCSCGAPECQSTGKHPHGRLCPKGAYSATTDEATLRKWWGMYPDLNVGIALDEHRFVIDIDPRNGGDESWDEIKDQGYPDGPVCLTGGGGQHIYGYSTNPIKGGKLGLGIDFKAGKGALVVAAPSRHESGRSYEWELSSQPDQPLPHGPEWVVGQFAGQGKKTATILNLDLSRVRVAPEIRKVSTGERNNEMTRLVGRWVAKGMHPDEVHILAEGANGTFDPPLGLTELRSVVQSVFDTDARNNPEKYVNLTVNATPEGVECDYPDKLLNPGGLLQEIMTHVDESSAVSHPIYALGGALVAVGTAAGQRVMTSTGLRTHNIIVILGYSGSGKNAPQMAVPSLFLCDPILQNLNGPNELTSSAAIMRYMEEHNNCMCFVDEIGHLFAAMSNPKSHMADLSGTIMKIWSSASAEVYQKPYSDRKCNIVLHYPHLSILGCSTPTKFWPSITTDDYGMGLMSRAIVMQSTHRALKPRADVRLEPDYNIVSMLSEIANMRQVFAQGSNLRGRPVAVKMLPKAAALMDEAEDTWRALNEQHRDDVAMSAIYSRCAEHAKKISLVHATSIHLSNVPHSGIGLDSVEWAVEFVNHVTMQHVESMKVNVSDSPWQKIQQRILKCIRRKRTVDKPGATARELRQNMRDIEGAKIVSAIKDLCDQGAISQIEYKPSVGRPTILIVENSSSE